MSQISIGLTVKSAWRLALPLPQIWTMYFCNSGAEANEGAVKMARRYHHARIDHNRHVILCAGGAFYGRTLGMLAATDRPIFREGFGPLASSFPMRLLAI